MQAEDAHQQLAARFPDGMIWVDCGLSLQVKFPQFSLDIRAKALTLARELLVDDEEMYLDSMVQQLNPTEEYAYTILKYS